MDTDAKTGDHTCQMSQYMTAKVSSQIIIPNILYLNYEVIEVTSPPGLQGYKTLIYTAPSPGRAGILRWY